MDYRDQLTAAYQQIEVLKSRLRELGDGGSASAPSIQEQLQQSLGQYQHYARELEARIAALEQENSQLRGPRAASPQLLTLYEYNRSQMPAAVLQRFEGAGVLCPYCRSIALHHGAQERPEYIEMVYTPSRLGDEIGGVACPKCLWSGYKKLG